MAEYIAALKNSGKFGPQVTAHRIYPATTATTQPPDLLAPELQQFLRSAGFAELYCHQHEALRHILAGKHVVVATPTASGKSLIYTLPVFQVIGEDAAAHALYLFPLKALAQDQLKTIEDVTHYIKAGGGCENCHPDIQKILDAYHNTSPEAVPAKKALTNIQKIRLIEETLDREIKPALQKDGGSIELIDVDGNRVLVKLIGTCATCKASQLTLKNYVEIRLQEMVSPDLVVEEVK